MTTQTMPLITRYSQLEALDAAGELSPAEKELIACVGHGVTARLGPMRPNLHTPSVSVRAEVLRYLILGGCEAFRTQPSGVALSGAWITGKLDLSYAKAVGPIGLFNCHFAERPQMVQLNVDGLNIVGCLLTGGMNAARIQVAGNLTLNGSHATGKVSLSGCDIRGHLSCTRATLRNEEGSALKAQGIKVASSVLLEGTVAHGQVSFLGAKIGGQLLLIGAGLHNPTGHALNAQSAIVQGDALLRYIETDGEISFMGADIGGVLDCTHATVRNGPNRALNAQRLIVREGFVWRRIQQIIGAIDLTSAHVGDLWDDAASWTKAEKLFLSGFRYDTLQGAINIEDRLAWLKHGAISKREFYPQPYEHLAKLLRDTGHRGDARAIMVAKEQEQRKASRKRWRHEAGWRLSLAKASIASGQQREEMVASMVKRRPKDKQLARFQLLHPTQPDRVSVSPDVLELAQFGFRVEHIRFGWGVGLRNGLSFIIDWVFGLVVGYGHRPERSFYVLIVLVMVGWVLADRAWQAGDFAPTSGPVLMSDDWQALATDPTIANPAKVWSDKYMVSADGQRTLTPGRDYETFHALSYAVDLVVPLVALGQEASWAPSTTRGPWGLALWWARWWLIALGWIVTAIGAAAVTGVIRRD